MRRTDAEDPDLPAAVLAAYQEIAAEPGEIGSGDVLVFLPGEREIRDVGEFLRARARRRRRGADAVFAPVLGAAEPNIPARRAAAHRAGHQRGRDLDHRTRHPLRHRLRPGARSAATVRATGCSDCRSSRYRAPAPSSARAAAGASGRGSACACTREADFEARPPFTEPEILRTNLAALLLRLAADGLGGAEDFPFIDAPDSRALNDGYRLLQELQALDAERRHHAAAAGPWRGCRSIRAWRGRCSRADASARRASCWQSSRA